MKSLRALILVLSLTAIPAAGCASPAIRSARVDVNPTAVSAEARLVRPVEVEQSQPAIVRTKPIAPAAGEINDPTSSEFYLFPDARSARALPVRLVAEHESNGDQGSSELRDPTSSKFYVNPTAERGKARHAAERTYRTQGGEKLGLQASSELGDPTSSEFYQER